MTDPARQYKSAPAPAFARTCDVKIERHGKWEHCDRTPICGFVDNGHHVLLCRQCARNVLRGDYGARLRDLFEEEITPDMRTKLADRDPRSDPFGRT